MKSEIILFTPKNVINIYLGEGGQTFSVVNRQGILLLMTIITITAETDSYLSLRFFFGNSGSTKVVKFGTFSGKKYNLGLFWG